MREKQQILGRKRDQETQTVPQIRKDNSAKIPFCLPVKPGEQGQQKRS